MRTAFTTAFCFLVFASTLTSAQSAPPQPVQLAPGLFRLAGTDAATGIEFIRFFLSAKSAPAVPAETGPQHTPDFIVECTQLLDRRTVSFYLTLGAVEEIGFNPPLHAGPKHRSVPKNPSVAFKMTFDGYARSKPFKTFWEKLPDAMYKYRNPSFRSPNLEDPRFFLQYLNSLPDLYIAPAKPLSGELAELSFDTSALLQQVSRAPLCQP